MEKENQKSVFDDQFGTHLGYSGFDNDGNLIYGRLPDLRKDPESGRWVEIVDPKIINITEAKRKRQMMEKVSESLL